MHQRVLPAAIVAALMMSSSALAADNDPDQPATNDRAVQLDAIEVKGARPTGYAVPDTTAATKLDLSPRETPQSLTIVTRQRLDDQDLSSVRKVLDNTNGVYSNQYDTERVLFYARGFPIDTLLVDGVPAQPNTNTGSIDETGDTALYDRIEIVRGATGLMSGAGSPAASVNLVRKHAVSREAAAEVDLGVGSWNDRRVEIDATTPLRADGRLRARGVAVYEDTASYQDFYRKKTAVLYGILDGDIGDATRVSLGFDHQNNRPRSNTWGSFPLFLADGRKANWPRSVSTAADWSYWNRRTDTVFAELQHAFANDWSLQAVANWRRYREDEELFYMYGFPDPETGAGLEPYAYKSKGSTVERALDVYATGPLELFGRRHELVAGVNLSRAKTTGTNFEPGALAVPGNFFEWDSHFPRPDFAPGVPLADIDTRQTGAYAAARWSLADPLKLVTGVRAARYRIDSFYLYDVPTDSKYDFRDDIPYAGLVYDVAPAFSLFASYTGIFKPQNARDITGHYLDPVVGRGAEVGLKGEHFDGALTSSFVVFDTRQDNIAAPVVDPETGEPVLFPDGSQVSKAVDGVHSRGFEVELAGRFSERWQGSIGGSRTLIEDQHGSAVRTFIPQTLVRAFSTYTPAAFDGALTLGGGVNWQSGSKTLVSAPAGGAVFHQPSVPLVSLMARWQVSPRVSLQFNASNVFDRKYYVLDEYDNTYYGAPASASASVRVAL